MELYKKTDNKPVYDNNNVFMKIIRGEIKSSIRYENDDYIVIDDISPCNTTHILLIPKNINVICVTEANAEEINKLFSYVSHFVELLKKNNFNRFTLTFNNIYNQQVPHIHIHIVSNEELSIKQQ